MTTQHEAPIFCDNCPSLALAALDDAPLCEKCLFCTLARLNDDGAAKGIRPLRFNAPKLITAPFSNGRDAA